MEALAEVSPLVGTVAACEALNPSRASCYRNRLPRISRGNLAELDRQRRA